MRLKARFDWDQTGRPVCQERATKPTMPGQEQTSVFPPFLVPSSLDAADYLLVGAAPTVADAAGGGIMFHVLARYFQSAPSCTITSM